jgi:hypothetical protein
MREKVLIQGCDLKWQNCTPHVVTVRGGRVVVFIADDGTEVAREPYSRAKRRLKYLEKRDDDKC